jgi:phospholipid/cholesterol/gamma-HCH transport system substrate-binding protein
VAEKGRRRVPRRHRKGISTFAAGVIFVVAAVVALYFGFSKHVPFTHGFRLRAVVASANSIRKNSFVRIAGVNVGTVKKISAVGDGKLSVIDMEIQDKGLPIHKDATLTIRPRIFLEGNFFVDLKPGTPSAPVLHDDDTIPVTQTSDPVQLDQVLTALQAPTRRDLQDLLRGYGTALEHTPAPGSDSDQDPQVQGLNGAQALRLATKRAPEALKTTAQVNEALLGEEPHDLSHIIANVAAISGALDSRETELQDLIVNFDRTMAATADESGNLEATIRELSPTLDAGNRALASLNRAFPPTRAFVNDVLPGVRETAATINASFPFVRQTKALLGPKELQGVAKQLRPTIKDSSKLIDKTTKLLPKVDLIQRCVSEVVLPSGNVVVKDPVPDLNTGKENYKEFWYALTGIAGESQNFDGNGQYVRFQPGGGLDTISLGPSTIDPSTLFGQSAAPPVATAPAYPTTRPAYHPEVPCYKSGPTTSDQVNGPAARGPSDQVVGSQPSGTSAIQDLLNGIIDILPIPLPLPLRHGQGDTLSPSSSGGAGAAAGSATRNGTKTGAPRAGAGTTTGDSTGSSPASGSTPSASGSAPSSSTAPAGSGAGAPTTAADGTGSPQSAPSTSSGGLVGKLLGALDPLQGIGR